MHRIAFIKKFYSVEVMIIRLKIVILIFKDFKFKSVFQKIFSTCGI